MPPNNSCLVRHRPRGHGSESATCPDSSAERHFGRGGRHEINFGQRNPGRTLPVRSLSHLSPTASLVLYLGMASDTTASAATPIFDSLPYYDDDLQKYPHLKEKVDQELARELKAPQTLHPRVPPPVELFAVREHLSAVFHLQSTYSDLI